MGLEPAAVGWEWCSCHLGYLFWHPVLFVHSKNSILEFTIDTFFLEGMDEKFSVTREVYQMGLSPFVEAVMGRRRRRVIVLSEKNIGFLYKASWSWPPLSLQYFSCELLSCNYLLLTTYSIVNKCAYTYIYTRYPSSFILLDDAKWQCNELHRWNRAESDTMTY